MSVADSSRRNNIALVLTYFCLLYWPSSQVNGIPIDNGVEGEPEIECGSTSVSVTFKTKNEFRGRLFVKGHFNDTNCMVSGEQTNGQRRAVGLTVPFDKCGLSRSRSLNPRGVTITMAVTVSFHPLFLTKVDRAFTIQCFYMEADKTVSQDVEVSEISTLFRSEMAPMPVCRYEIFDTDANGKPIRFAVLGQQVYHKWTCTSDTTDIFCMQIRFCYVTDGQGNNADLLDPNGCSLDKHILGNLDYLTDLMAGKEAHVFKFADVPSLIFRCQVSIGLKEVGQKCPLPDCPTTGRRKRTAGAVGVVDVISQSIFIADVDETTAASFVQQTVAPVSKEKICLLYAKVYFIWIVFGLWTIGLGIPVLFYVLRFCKTYFTVSN